MRDAPMRRSTDRRWHRAAAAPLLGLVATAFGPGCADRESAPHVVDRDHRFGIFRDLVLQKRAVAEGGPFFLDRFEATAADFASFRSGGVSGERVRTPDLRPEANIDLVTARRFARWRFCRIPRADEWRYACTQAGTYTFPWGNTFVETLANTGSLGIGEVTPVGSFASGGSIEGGPFDLVGNLAEWTETVADPMTGIPVPFAHLVERDALVERVVGLPEWPSFSAPDPSRDGIIQDHPTEHAGELPLGLRVWLPLWAPVPGVWLDRGDFGGFTEQRWEKRKTETLDMPGIARFRRAAGLRAWLPDWDVAPTDWLVFAEDDELERQVVGGHFRSIVPDKKQVPSARYWLPGQYDGATGVRVAADPEGLLYELLSLRGAPPEPEAEATLRRFLRVPAHREVLREALPRVLESAPGNGTLRELLIDELGGG